MLWKYEGDEAQMAKATFADLISGVPGDYIIQRRGYDRDEDFVDEMRWTRAFCERNGFFFTVAGEENSGVPDAFFVNIR